MKALEKIQHKTCNIRLANEVAHKPRFMPKQHYKKFGLKHLVLTNGLSHQKAFFKGENWQILRSPNEGLRLSYGNHFGPLQSMNFPALND